MYKKFHGSFAAYVFSPLIYQRRLHVYCISAPRSGTLSLAHIFKQHYRSEHEPDSYRTVRALYGFEKKQISGKDLKSFLAKRDRRWQLDVEASHFLVYGLPFLVELFPEARFILTIRDCISWLESNINQVLHQRVLGIETSTWDLLAELRHGRNEKHPPEEQFLEQLNLYTVDGYLSNWTWQNQYALQTIPADRLLILRTSEITERISDIASFVGVPIDTLNLEKSHMHKGVKSVSLLDHLSEEYLMEKVNRHCRPIMDVYYPSFAIQG
jgi:hypothetical protein